MNPRTDPEHPDRQHVTRQALRLAEAASRPGDSVYEIGRAAEALEHAYEELRVSIWHADHRGTTAAPSEACEGC